VSIASEPLESGISGVQDEPPSQDLLEVVERRMSELSSHPDERVRVAVEELLTAVDMVHRGGLTHLVDGIRSLAGDAFLNRLTEHATVRLLLMSYGLVQVDRSLQAQEALDPVREHLHQHGVEVDLLEVVGGVVYVRLHGIDDDAISEAAVRRDLEIALRHDFLGFQQLEIGERPGMQSGALVQIGAPRERRRPRFVRACSLGTLATDRLTRVVAEDEVILLIRLPSEPTADDGVRAIRNQCGDSPLPLENATLEGSTLVCPWHGCRYDLRTGRRLDPAAEPSLFLLPLRIEGDDVMVAVGTEPIPRDDRA
jgi:3-phenylpropionate/trans-cinnamate dioxygenase ferredoxin component